MIARIAKAMNKKDGDKGFTLVELLVVVIIIGILAAVAIPIYLNQQKKAQDSATQSDLKNAQVALASWIVSNPDGDVTSFDETALNGEGVQLSPNTTGFAVTAFGTDGGFCIGATNDKGSVKDYSITDAGVLSAGSTDCTAPTP